MGWERRGGSHDARWLGRRVCIHGERGCSRQRLLLQQSTWGDSSNRRYTQKKRGNFAHRVTKFEAMLSAMSWVAPAFDLTFGAQHLRWQSAFLE